MKRSTDRIRTTHAGSLPRPDDLTRMMWDGLDNKPVDKAVLTRRVAEAVQEAVNKQRAAGVDIVSDGEMSKVGFSNYVIQRFSGFGERAQFMATDLADFPVLIQKMFIEDEGGQHLVMPVVDGPIELRDRDAVKLDIANLKAALGDVNPDDAFIPAVTPGQMLFNFPNRYYPSREAYLEAAGNALRVEYQAIIDAGFNLQLDAPDLAMHHHSFSDGKGPIALKNYIPTAIEALNHATRGLPPDKCGCIYAGAIMPGRTITTSSCATSSSRFSRRAPLSSISRPPIRVTSTNGRSGRRSNCRTARRSFPASSIPSPTPSSIRGWSPQRLERFANIVGKENVIGGTDCGFGTFVGFHNCDPKIAWLKLEALTQGASLASDRLW